MNEGMQSSWGEVEAVVGKHSAGTRVGIGMPIYNGEKYLEQTLRAHQAQTYDDFSVVITDNASSDRTRELCLDYCASDARFSYLRYPVNVGAPQNFVRSFQRASGEFFRWANADDLPEPGLLEACLDALDKNPDVVLAYGKTRLIDAEGAVIRNYEDNLDLRQPQPSDRFRACFEQAQLVNIIYGLIRRAPLAKTRLIAPYQGSDVNLIAELSLYGKFFELGKYLFQRRLHPAASTWDGDAETQRLFWKPFSQKLLMRSWQSLYEHQRAVLRAPIPFAEKRKLLAFLTRVAWWKRHHMRRDLITLVRFSVLKR